MTIEESRRFLARSISARGPAQAYLVTGAAPGDRLAAGLLIAQALFCAAEASRPCLDCAECRHAAAGEHPDLFRVSGAGDRGFLKIDQVRELKREICLSPFRAPWRVYLVEAAGIREEAANAFLKTLEEPPPTAVIVILAQTEREMLPTIVSRATRINLPDPDFGIPDFPEAEQLLGLSRGNPALIFDLARKIADYSDEKLALFLHNLAVSLVLAAKTAAGVRPATGGDPAWLAALAARDATGRKLLALAEDNLVKRREITRGAVSARLALETILIAITGLEPEAAGKRARK